MIDIGITTLPVFVVSIFPDVDIRSNSQTMVAPPGRERGDMRDVDVGITVRGNNPQFVVRNWRFRIYRNYLGY